MKRTTRLRAKFASDDNTLAAGSSCNGSRTFFPIVAFETLDAAPDWSEFAKNVHGKRPTKRNTAYDCSPVSVRGREPRSTPNRIQNTTSCSSGMRKFQPNPRTEPL